MRLQHCAARSGQYACTCAIGTCTEILLALYYHYALTGIAHHYCRASCAVRPYTHYLCAADTCRAVHHGQLVVRHTWCWQTQSGDCLQDDNQGAHSAYSFWLLLLGVFTLREHRFFLLLRGRRQRNPQRGQITLRTRPFLRYRYQQPYLIGVAHWAPPLCSVSRCKECNGYLQRTQ